MPTMNAWWLHNFWIDSCNPLSLAQVPFSPRKPLCMFNHSNHLSFRNTTLTILFGVLEWIVIGQMSYSRFWWIEERCWIQLSIWKLGINWYGALLALSLIDIWVQRAKSSPSPWSSNQWASYIVCFCIFDKIDSQQVLFQWVQELLMVELGPTKCPGSQNKGTTTIGS
jgi:hypothetical protein